MRDEDLKNAKLKEAGEHKQAERGSLPRRTYVITMVFSICNNDGHEQL